MYKLLIRPILFLFPPESAHHLVVFLLKIPGVSSLMGLLYMHKNQKLERTVFGLKFPNPVGLAAGFDKDAKFFDEISSCGFGFIEVGTVTPKPQSGNDKPRSFRLPQDSALINRMGFNNEGVEAMVKRLTPSRSTEGGEPAIRGGRRYIIGGNIGKNKITPNENAIDDYVYCFEKLFDYVDYFVVNVSSPNTPGLRELQEKEPLKKILNRLMAMNARPPSPKGQPQVATEGQRPGYPSGRGGKPILLKIAPDLTNEQLDDIIEIVSETKIDGVVATNTTISRENLRTPNSRLQSLGSGGLSGKPLTKRSTEVVKYLHEKSHGSFPIIASGGIHSAEDAVEKLKAGASLVQLYTGFIYEGPGLIRSIVRRLMTEDRRNTNTVN